MENKITIELPMDRIQQAVNDAMENILKSGYGNPVKDCVERAFKEKGGEVEAFVKQVITDSLTKPEFKEKMGEIVIQNLVTSAMKKN